MFGFARVHGSDRGRNSLRPSHRGVLQEPGWLGGLDIPRQQRWPWLVSADILERPSEKFDQATKTNYSSFIPSSN